MDQQGRGLGRGQGSEPAEVEIRLPEVCAPGGLRLEDVGVGWERCWGDLSRGLGMAMGWMLMEAFPVF